MDFSARLVIWLVSSGVFLCLGRNTITYRLEGGTEVSSTMNSYQHFERVAICIAILLPLLHELYLWKKRKASQLT